MKTTKKRSSVLSIIPIVAAFLVGAGGTAMTQDEQQAGATETQESRQETTRTVRRYEETTTTVRRGVTGDVPRPPANELWPEYTETERLWYNLSQMPGM